MHSLVTLRSSPARLASSPALAPCVRACPACVLALARPRIFAIHVGRSSYKLSRSSDPDPGFRRRKVKAQNATARLHRRHRGLHGITSGCLALPTVRQAASCALAHPALSAFPPCQAQALLRRIAQSSAVQLIHKLVSHLLCTQHPLMVPCGRLRAAMPPAARSHVMHTMRNSA